MSVTLKRRSAEPEFEAALARLQELAREQAERLGPYAEVARDNAARRFRQARGWTAPRLENAAERVEDTVAPRVANLLVQAAQKVEPEPPKRLFLRGRRAGGRRVPRTLIVVGVAAAGAAAVYGVVRMRQSAQEAEWQESLRQAREQVRDTVTAKAREARETLRGQDSEGAEQSTDGSPGAAKDHNGRIPN
ncbi:hypothetical protein RIF23_15235 [Lipingzhangella sp. LS1_29]|uniref:DUF3618 domain-containing protein n=1 Tax=Lipingzhangella rawalii TaxID=2055835 RepID=A0ABU2H8L5_9ACTN|nr:hypothetical protein [Lipingzhangella rawalii]MDS1271648.1 hypothetical protein [Lipingzhangella rawalii]